MTLNQILDLYDISFIKIRDNQNSYTKLFYGGGEMEMFFTYFREPDNIEEEVIQLIDHYLNGNPFPVDNDLTVGNGDFIEVSAFSVTFTNRESFIISQSIPLNHFRAITQAWVNYLRNG
ncbi:hypothetical protein [Flavobacterium sp. Root186]|uniref:hypothetical protein n=1 Tax=Flavobacterium sp. Root186 TaxID=1736485 RepID=UPI0006F3F9A3|nr:hypothetical protein [Flavobacterium sp. Root186]KRB56739.1 hypothetical protein ASD98_08595 [Flavobacterium sp. Root186]